MISIFTREVCNHRAFFDLTKICLTIEYLSHDYECWLSGANHVIMEPGPLVFITWLGYWPPGGNHVIMEVGVRTYELRCDPCGYVELRLDELWSERREPADYHSYSNGK